MKNNLLSIYSNFFVLLICCLTLSVANAQITLDGTMGQSGPLSGPNYQINADMGKQTGSNLFHSFGKFNIDTGESATFNGPNTVSNIIGRVTGGSESLIDGRIQSTIQNADLFLINPSGMIFGPNASLNIDGSFHVGTADYLSLGDGGRFDAVQPEKSVLTTSPPSAFGFLSDHPEKLTVEGFLSVPAGQDLSLVGGDVEVTSGFLSAGSGTVNISSAASPGQAPITGSGVDTSAFPQQGAISFSLGSKVTVNSLNDHPSGEIYIRGGQFAIKDGGTSVTSISDTGQGGGIDIRLSEELVISDSAQIAIAGNKDGQAGNVVLDVKKLNLNDGGRILASGFGNGQSGDISVNARESVHISGETPSNSGLYADAFGSGDAGNISLKTDTLILSDGGLISGVAHKVGQGGNITLNLEHMDVNGEGKIVVSNLDGGESGDISVSAWGAATLAGNSGLYAQAEGVSGSGGNISVSATRLCVTEDSRISTSSNGYDPAGEATIHVGQLELTNGGVVITSGYGFGRSGDISVNASDSAEISGSGVFSSALSADAYGSGDAGDISVNTGELTLAYKGTITSVAHNHGESGDMTLEADRLNITGGRIDTGSNGLGSGGNISIAAQQSVLISGKGGGERGAGLYANASGSGNAGAVDISTESLTLSDNGMIISATSGMGRGGDIMLETDDMEVGAGGKVISRTEAEGNGGNISVSAQKSVTISGSGSGVHAVASDGSTGQAGNVTLSTGALSLKDDGVISGETHGNGQGGNVTLTADSLTATGGGMISTTTSGNGHGGDISVTIRESAVISGAGRFSSGLVANANPGSAGDAGDIILSANDLTIKENGVIFNQAHGSGQGGHVNVRLNQLDVMTRGEISTDTSGATSGGNISVTAQDRVTVSGDAKISATTDGRIGSGNAGHIDIATGMLTVADEGVINSGTTGAGDGGKITLTVDRLHVDQGYVSSSSGGETPDSGDCGEILITAQESVHVAGSGKTDDGRHAPYYGVYSQTLGPGKGGQIAISTKEMTLSHDGWINCQTYGAGKGGDVTVAVDRLNAVSGGTITTSTRCTGEAGDISITAAELVNVSGPGTKQPRSWIYAGTWSSGSGGDVHISTPVLRVSDGGAIYADTLNENEGRCEEGIEKPDGRAGDIALDVARMELTQGGIVSAGTDTAGRGGDISITARESVGISGSLDRMPDPDHTDPTNSGVYAWTRSSGEGGTLTISTRPLILSDKGEINTSSSGSGEGGDIGLEADRLQISTGASITAESSGDGASGTVTVHASEFLRNEGGILSTESASAKGGDIFVTTPVLSASDQGLISASISGGDQMGGDVTIHATRVDLKSGSRIESATSGKGQGGVIAIHASDSVMLTGAAAIHTEGEASGKAGDIQVKESVRTVVLTENARISSANTGEGDAGSITITAQESAILKSGDVTTEAAKGKGGTIILTTPELSASDNGKISASVSGGDDVGGDVEIHVTNLRLKSGARLESSADDQARGGVIRVHASESVAMADDAKISTQSFGTGKAGDIRLEAGLKRLGLKNAEISSSNAGTGDAGAVTIDAKESVRLEAASVTTEANQGMGGTISVTTPRLSATGGGTISAGVRGGDQVGGDVAMNVTILELDSSSRIGSSAGGEARGGVVRIRADSVRLNGSAGISTESVGSGKAGNIFLKEDLRTLALRNAKISSSNSGTGDAGSVTIDAGESVILESGSVTTEAAQGKGGNITIAAPSLSLDSNGTISASVREGIKGGGKIKLDVTILELGNASRIESATSGEGKGGEVHIRASGSVRLRDETSVSAKSFGTGDAGDIFLSAGDTLRMERSAVITGADEADGGNIFINAKSSIHLTDSDITATVGGGEGDGGNIRIDPEAVILERSRIIANAYAGDGGNIEIVADAFVQSADSEVTASSELGIEGSVEIKASDADVSALAALPGTFPDASRWLKTPCSARTGEKVSRLIVEVRDGLPAPLDDWLTSPPLRFDGMDEAISVGDLIATGEAHYQKGDVASAVRFWETALTSLNPEDEVYAHILEYLACTYPSLGYYQKPRLSVEKLLPVIEKASDPFRSALLLSRLGDILLSLGDMTEADATLKEGMRQARLTRRPALLASVLNNRGNLLAIQKQYGRAMAAYKESLGFLGETTETAFLHDLKSKVLTNMARVRWMRKDDGKVIVSALNRALRHVQSLPDSWHKAADLISAGLLARDIRRAHPQSGDRPREICRIALEQAKKIAETIRDARLLSHACGHLGKYHLAQGRHADALRLTRRASFLAQQANLPELLYLWQWQAGRIFGAEHDLKGSVNAYSEAVKTLKPVRKEFFTGYRRRDTFQEKVRPVYLELAELLLKQADATKDEKRRESFLRGALDKMELLKTAEIEDYFEDECLKKENVKPDPIPSRSAVLYPIPFPNHLTLLLMLPDGITRTDVPVGSDELGKHAKRLQKRLQGFSKISRILNYANPLYDWLIRPIEQKLNDREIDTLILAPDGPLRLIPFNALHDDDEKRFLVEKYALVTIPSITLTDLRPLEQGDTDALLNGLSQGRTEGGRTFPPLPAIPGELASIREMTGGRTLMDEAYTIGNLTDAFKGHAYSVVHLATHGVFGGSPENTFLLTYDGRLTMDRLEDILAIGRFRERQVELLTLSACQTAQGDERAALGLAGVALKAGARSAIATLWFIDDQAASLTVREFYRQLLTVGMSKAKALQNAQKRLIGRGDYRHPSYWAPFLLIGNWL